MRSRFTLKSSVVLEGNGIHDGKYSKLILKPRHNGFGLRLGDNSCIQQIFLNNIWGLDRRTVIKTDKKTLQTVEHLMAALAYLNVTNIDIIVIEGDEVPIYDGTSWRIIEKILQVGLLELQNIENFNRNILHEFKKYNTSLYNVIKNHEFNVSITIDLFNNTFSSCFTISDTLKFIKIMKSKTFIIHKDLTQLHSQGLGYGINNQCCYIINSNLEINERLITNLIYHKILDFIGDLYLVVGYIPNESFILKNPHHRYNIKYCKDILGFENTK